MITVAIIVPTWHYFANPFKLQPLYELYFATVIDAHFKQNGVGVRVIDLRHARGAGNRTGNIQDLTSCIPEQDIYLYWITKTADYPELLQVVERIRNTYPKAKHIAGGTHVVNFADECKNYFDAVVLGPGERGFLQAINDCRAKTLQKVYQSDWADVQYNDYPFARRDYLPKEAIVNTVLFEKYGGILGTSAMFSRGCNFRCAYCVYNVPPSIQMRSPASVEKEIEYLKNEYKIKGVNLRDEICIPLSPRVAIPYIEAIGQTNVMWRGQTKIGANRKILALARQTGCVELAVGVESVCQQVVDIVNKRHTIKQARDFIEACKSVGIKVKMCLILGLPGEPPEIVSMTRKFIEEVKPDYVNVSGFCPVPGSEIFNNSEYYGIKYVNQDWSKHAHLLFRFSDEEYIGLPFEYHQTNRWGRAFSRDEIASNIRQLQHYLRDHNMCY
jgi:radical SAM superfamily enzyme YgiQ (UPF0313 family)